MASTEQLTQAKDLLAKGEKIKMVKILTKLPEPIIYQLKRSLVKEKENRLQFLEKEVLRLRKILNKHNINA